VKMAPPTYKKRGDIQGTTPAEWDQLDTWRVLALSGQWQRCSVLAVT
jgi:hypothetical protein